MRFIFFDLYQKKSEKTRIQTKRADDKRIIYVISKKIFPIFQLKTVKREKFRIKS